MLVFDQLGGDVKLFRSGTNALTVEGSVGVSGDLDVESIKVGDVSLDDIIKKLLQEARGKKQD